VIFTVDDPQPGRWQVVVETHAERHTAYSVGGWVRSPLQLVAALDRSPVGAGSVFARIGLQLQAGRDVDIRYAASLSGPPAPLSTLLDQYKDLLRQVRPDRQALKDGVDDSIARLMALDQKLRADGKPSIFAPVTTRLRVVPDAAGPAVTGPVDGHWTVERMSAWLPGRPGLTIPGSGTLAAKTGLERAMTHSLRAPARLPGSYTVRIGASGADRRTRCRFERHVALCFVVR
jgi:hypothetical protein